MPENIDIVPEIFAWRQSSRAQVLLLAYIPQERTNKKKRHKKPSQSLAQMLYQLHHGQKRESLDSQLPEILAIEKQDWQKILSRWQKLLTGHYLGFLCNNFIGRTGQQNLKEHETAFFPAVEWPEFFAEFRLLPMFQACWDMGLLNSQELRAGEHLCRSLTEILPRLEKASLLHGDLWAGNVLNKNDSPTLIDPACYYGHCEVDLAMTRMFGGFSESFYCEYKSLWPLAPGWSQRFEIYNLYHWLNHLRLFGTSYLSAVRNILRKFSI